MANEPAFVRARNITTRPKVAKVFGFRANRLRFRVRLNCSNKVLG